jgi:PhnB protein
MPTGKFCPIRGDRVSAESHESQRPPDAARSSRRVSPAKEEPIMTAEHVPAGHHTATPYLIVRDATRAIDFYIQAFQATELMRLADPGGRLAHAEIQIGDSPIMLADEVPEWGNYSPQSFAGSAGHIHLYVEDVDALVGRAVAAGAKVLIPVADRFYGDRGGRLADPFGHIWIVATHKEDVSPAEITRRFEAAMKQT